MKNKEEFEIRPAQSEDFPAIIRLWHQAWHDAHRALVPQSILAYRRPNHFRIWLEQSPDQFYIASADQLLGFVSVCDAELVKLYVKADIRGTGVAAALLAYGENRIAEDGGSVAELFCTAGNIRAQKFYARHGWKKVRTFEDGLWLPGTANETFLVQTHLYRKRMIAG